MTVGSWADLGSDGAEAIAAAAAGLPHLRTVRLEYNGADAAAAARVQAVLAQVPADGVCGPGTGLKVS